MPAETWLGYWSDETAERVHDKLRGENCTGNASWILRDLTYYYEPICSTVYTLYAVRSALLKHVSVQGALSGTVVSTFFDGIVVKAFPSKRPIQSITVTGNNGGRLNTVRTRQPLHRNIQVNCQGLPTLRVGNRQVRRRSYFQYVTTEIPRSNATPTTQYGKITARNRWKYQGDVIQIAKDEHVANIPLPHLIYGCKFEAKGKRFRVVPREPMDNLMKFIDGSEPGEPPHVMLAVDQNDQVRVWQNSNNALARSHNS